MTKWPKRIVGFPLSGWDDARAWNSKVPRGGALYQLVPKRKKVKR